MVFLHGYSTTPDVGIQIVIKLMSQVRFVKQLVSHDLIRRQPVLKALGTLLNQVKKTASAKDPSKKEGSS